MPRGTNIAKTTPKRVLVRMALTKNGIKRPSVISRHKRLRMERASKYMKTHMKLVIFTDASRASQVRLDGWAKE